MRDPEQPPREDRSGSRGEHQSRHHERRHRKERVLHTRVSEQLSEDIKRLADDLRVPVSNLVRNVLEEVFTVVENVSEDVGEFFEEVVDEAEGVRERIRNQQWSAQTPGRETRRSGRGGRDRGGPTDVEEELRRDEATEGVRQDGGREGSGGVLGWQPIVLNQAVGCTGCGAHLEPGTSAFMAISHSGALGRLVCPACSPANS